jgi:hypothetical protein
MTRLLIILLSFISLNVKGETNAQQARKLFDSVYNMVFGEEGSTLHYDVNIIGIYKTNGTIWYKGKKSRYGEARYASWNDGVTAYMIDHKKKVVDIYRSNDDNKDKYMSKFKFNANDYSYSWANAKDGIEITIKPKTSHLMGIREVKGMLDRNTHYPLYLRIKVAFFWTTVKISNFRAGNINDNIFIFPRNQFRGYEFSDHRNDR